MTNYDILKEYEAHNTPVPSYEEWKPFTDEYFNGLTAQDIAELAKKSIGLTKQHCEDNERIEKLEKLLKECREVAEFTKTIVNKHKWFNEVITKIDEVLK